MLQTDDRRYMKGAAFSEQPYAEAVDLFSFPVKTYCPSRSIKAL